MRQETYGVGSTLATGLSVAAALALCAGQAFAQTSAPTTGGSKTSTGASSGASKSAGGKTYSNASAKKAAPAATKSGTSTKPLVSGGSTLSDLVGGPAANAQPTGAAHESNPEGEEKAGSAENGVKVSDYMTVDIFVQDEDLANVLQMLSLQSRKNIIASKDVSATVSANLYGVTFYEALDSVLHVNGYGYVEKGNFIYVHTLEEIAAIEAAERKMVSKVLRLNYLNANDAAEFVTPLLSEGGQIKTNGDVGEFSVPEDSPTGNEQYALSAMLVVFDYADHIAEIEELLKQIDTKPAQVLVEATILQTSLTEANAFGVDFSVLHDVNFLDFLTGGGPLGAPGAIGGTGTDIFGPSDNEGSAVSSTAGNFAGPGTIKAAILADQVGVFIRALDEVGNVTILSNPKILALNRQPAKVLVGRKLGYLNTTATETSTTQTVEFLDTGTQLAFRPFVSNDGMVRMELKPRVSEGVIRTASDATGAAVTIPDEITQEITTNVIVPDGSTVVLGGLFKETTKLNRSQVPVLGDIPIVGLAFQGRDDSTDRQEIIFMIKPTVVHDRVLAEQGDRSVAYAERVRTGSRQGLLPFSRERQTAQLNLEAERLASEGNTDGAMWKLRRSLELNPEQPDAIRLKEQIQGKRDLWPSGSVLERVIDGEASINPAMPSRGIHGVEPKQVHLNGVSPASQFGPQTSPEQQPGAPVLAETPSEPQASAVPVNLNAEQPLNRQPASTSLFGTLANMLQNPDRIQAGQPAAAPTLASPSTLASASTASAAPAQPDIASATPAVPTEPVSAKAEQTIPGITIIPVSELEPVTASLPTGTLGGFFWSTPVFRQYLSMVQGQQQGLAQSQPVQAMEQSPEQSTTQNPVEGNAQASEPGTSPIDESGSSPQ